METHFVINPSSYRTGAVYNIYTPGIWRRGTWFCADTCWMSGLKNCPCRHMVRCLLHIIDTPSTHLIVLNSSSRREHQQMFQSWKLRTQDLALFLSLCLASRANWSWYLCFVQARENGLGLKKYSGSRHPGVPLKAESRARSVLGNKSHLLTELSQDPRINTTQSRA